MASQAFLIAMWALEVVLWCGVVFGVAIDIFSCRAYIRRRRTGRGPSGIPLLGLILFLLRILVRPLDMVWRVHRPWWLLVFAFVMAVAFHLACQIVAPRALAKRGA
jgi:phosphoglycerol transferase MdoB-like AlkP superfamily enzyme